MCFDESEVLCTMKSEIKKVVSSYQYLGGCFSRDGGWQMMFK